MGRSCVAARGPVPPGIPPLIRRRHSQHSAFQRRRWGTWHRPVHASQRHLLQPADAWQWRTVRRSNPGRSQGQLRMLIPLLWITASQSTAVNIKPVCVDTRLSTHSTTEHSCFRCRREAGKDNGGVTSNAIIIFQKTYNIMHTGFKALKAATCRCKRVNWHNLPSGV